jgi:hypothetical protein
LQELGIEPRDLLELDIASAIFGGNRDNGVGTTRAGGPRNTFNANRSSYTSGENKGALPSENRRGGAEIDLEDEEILFCT